MTLLGSHSTRGAACAALASISSSPSAARGPAGGRAADGTAAWAGIGHEVSVGDGLRSPGPGCPPSAGQQWPRLQDFGLWAGTSGPSGGCLHHHGEESFPPGKPAPLFPVKPPWSPSPRFRPLPCCAEVTPHPAPSQAVLNKRRRGRHLVVGLCFPEVPLGGWPVGLDLGPCGVGSLGVPSCP